MNNKELITTKTPFTEYMNKGFNGSYNKENPEMSIQMADRLVLANGVTLSIQASRYHYCIPRQHSPIADYDFYEAFEVGYPTEELSEEFTQYAEDPDNLTETVYSYVPKELIQKYIDSVGGVVEKPKFLLRFSRK